VDDPAQLAALFKILSVETRLRIVRLLQSHPLCVNGLARRLNITPAAVSQHLRVLRHAGLVQSERRGYFMHYRINAAALARCGEQLQSLLSPPPLRRELLERYIPNQERK